MYWTHEPVIWELLGRNLKPRVEERSVLGGSLIVSVFVNLDVLWTQEPQPEAAASLRTRCSFQSDTDILRNVPLNTFELRRLHVSAYSFTV